MFKPESHLLDYKSLRHILGKSADFFELAKDCVAFSNSDGGKIVIGIEDNAQEPPLAQRIDDSLVDTVRKRVGELTVNVQIVPTKERHASGGEMLVISIPRANGVASTCDGRYFIRVGDKSEPITGDDILRLVDERPTIPWETMNNLDVSFHTADQDKIHRLCWLLRDSDRTKASVKEKTDAEILAHYLLCINNRLTNLGVLLVGTASQRGSLGTAPVVQAIRYDEYGNRIRKDVWDDYSESPVELIDSVWRQVTDFRESYELPDGLFRTSIPAYDEAVIRELLVNAIVHRPYTQRGDIFINLYPDRLEIVNPGRLPIGVTPKNILHTSRRRNDHLARVFHDLGFMEREGSGLDLIYDRLLTSGRGIPIVKEGADSVHVLIPRRVIRPETIQLLSTADRHYHLAQRERIALGILAQTDDMSAEKLAEQLELDSTQDLQNWISRLVDLGLISYTGKTRARRYFVPPELLRSAGLDNRTTLSRIQPHRLRALILEDIERYPGSAVSDVERRIGSEVTRRKIQSMLQQLVSEKEIRYEGERRWRRYFPINSSKKNGL